MRLCANLVKQAWEDGDPPARRPRPARTFMIAVDFQTPAQPHSMIAVDFMLHVYKIHRDHGESQHTSKIKLAW